MIEYKKTIKINDDRILKFYISDGYAQPMYTIMEGFIENDEIKKTYNLSQWDDYGFTAWINNIDKDIKTISYEFDINHPLYIPLIHLLNYDEELIIDDDDEEIIEEVIEPEEVEEVEEINYDEEQIYNEVDRAFQKMINDKYKKIS